MSTRAGAYLDGRVRPALPLGPYLVFLILVVATIPWRSKNFFDGGFDLVVVLKAALSVAGLGLALLLAVGRPRRELPATPLLFLLLYLSCTAIGGFGSGDLVPSLVVAVRVVVLATSVIVLARSFDGLSLLTSLFAALATVAAVAAVTGVATLGQGRLSGGFPPLHPNDMAAACALVIIWSLWRVSRGEDAWLHIAAALAALGVLIATGSRTSLGALAAACLYLVLCVRAVRLRTLVLGLVAVPVVFWGLAGTRLVQNLFTRGQTSDRIATLSNRTIAWRAALGPQDSPWLQWFGGGLVRKQIDVTGQYWTQQILDSSWISALVQGGVIGLVVCVVWVLHSLTRIFRSQTPIRTLQIAVVIYLLLRSLLESGLFDASIAFIVFFTAMMITPAREPFGAVELPERAEPTRVPAGPVPG